MQVCTLLKFVFFVFFGKILASFCMTFDTPIVVTLPLVWTYYIYMLFYTMLFLPSIAVHKVFANITFHITEFLSCFFLFSKFYIYIYLFYLIFVGSDCSFSPCGPLFKHHYHNSGLHQ